jgi:pSer/pThr/pTyr-binding forkhead associated (FHA) protein
MAQVTQTYKRTFSGSVGAGIGSLIGGRNKQYYMLEHRITSRYHRAGETQEIIVDQIEIGRDRSCQVRFDETFPTVSRRHAAIIREGDRWKLINISKTNPTLLNGNPVSQEWYLQSGDEIQLSVGGPKLGFIIPSGNGTGSIGLTRRLGLFGQQALRPYRRAIVLLSVALLLAVAGMTTWKLHGDSISGSKIDSLTLKADSLEITSKTQYDSFRAEQDSLVQVIEKTKKDLGDEKERNKKMKADLERRIGSFSSPSQSSKPRTTPVTVGSAVIDNEAVEACLPYIYFIYVEKIEIISPDKERFETDSYRWTATGFLLEDGRLVTARHAVEPWYFIRSYSDSVNLILNYTATNGGRVTVHFAAISSTGDCRRFTNHDVVCHRSSDRSVVTEEGFELHLSVKNDGDWAYLSGNGGGGLKIDKRAAVSLARGVELTILGFPLGLGVNAVNDIKPIWSRAITSSEGLNNGVILTTDTNYEHGSSGGPALYKDAGGNLVVVGIVSSMAGRSTGFIVPVSSIY